MSLNKILWNLWKVITIPSPAVSDAAERRRAELLAALTFFFAVLNLIGLGIGWRSGNIVGIIVLSTLSTMLITAYILSRTRNYRVGVWLTLAVWVVATFGYALSGHTTNGPHFVFAIFLPLAFTFGAAWLSLRKLTMFLAINLVGLLVTPLIDPAIAGRQFYLLVGVLTCLCGLFLLTQNYRDIIERERLESLQYSETRLRGIIENSPDYILELDRDGTIKLINRDQDKYLGKKVQEWLLEKDIPRINKAIEKAFSIGEMRSLEIQSYDTNGALTWDSVRVGPIRRGGEVSSLALTMTDITARKQAEVERENLIGELENRNAELERYAYTLSHELKTPLVTMQGFLGYLEEALDVGNVKQAKSDLVRIAKATEKMNHMIKELLDLSRVGLLMNPPDEVPFDEIVDEALEQLEGKLNRSRIKFDVDRNLPIVYGDRLRLVEVVQNLVDNAIKYMDDQPEPHIEIGTRGENEAGHPVFFVKDNGIGIDPAYHEKVFGLFDKLNPKSEGTGIGLALVKRIIETHGGRIWVESDGRGRGSCFCFTLPKTV